MESRYIHTHCIKVWKCLGEKAVDLLNIQFNTNALIVNNKSDAKNCNCKDTFDEPCCEALRKSCLS